MKSAFASLVFLLSVLSVSANAASDVCVLNFKSMMAQDPNYYNLSHKEKHEESEQFFVAECTVAADSQSVQLTKRIWTATKEYCYSTDNYGSCRAHNSCINSSQENVCHSASEETKLMDSTMAKAKIISVLLGLGYTLKTSDVLVR